MTLIQKSLTWCHRMQRILSLDLFKDLEGGD